MPTKPIVKLQLRLPKARHEELVQTAKRNKTSMHAEMLRRLAHDSDALELDAEWTWMMTTIRLIWERMNGQQAATWTTPKSWAKAQVRPPQADGDRSDG